MAQFDNMNEQEQMQMLMSQLQDSNLRQSVMQYLDQTANGLDKDANSKVLIETLARESVHNQKSTAMWKSRTKKSVAVGVVAVVLAITVQFLVNYLTNELSKESHVDKQGAMVSTDGKVVKTQMEEMKVGADGKLLSRNGDASVKTMPTLAKVALASSLPDATLMALDEITVHSDKGYTLQIKVHGFSRVPVLNSRCGNIVHFYTAWKGRVTLDSTDLSFDEATAAEFENAGFSLATGGRRLAGKINVDGFAKALDGMKESGKWTCADVPLPTFSELGDRKETKYTQCGAKNDKVGQCYSQFGGLKIGVAALEGSLASAVASKTAQVQGKTTNQLYVKSSSAVMNSELYRVEFSEYAMHPGQQLVAITDVASGKTVTFQIESDKSRSHCSVAAAEMERALQAVQKDPKVDSDWHFEYMGTSEEEGSVLRHFRIMFSSEFTKYIWGDASKVSLTNFAEFWDVAETMQPHRLLFGGGGDVVRVFDSYKQGVTDAEVDAAVKGRTGKTVAELMSCTDEEKEQRGRPAMDLFEDLSRGDASYYEQSSAKKSEALSKYLDSAGSSSAMPDFCYDTCKAPVDAAAAADEDMCQGTGLAAALECLQATGSAACQNSNFVLEHIDDHKDCGANATVQRTLEESEEPVELLVKVNETRVAKARKLGVEEREEYEHTEGIPVTWKCAGATGMVYHFPDGSGSCIKWKFESLGFKLIISWGLINGHMALTVECLACVNLLKLFGIPPPLYAKVCVGGAVTIGQDRPCPNIDVYMTGKAYFTFSVGLEFWVCYIDLAKIELGVKGGYGWVKVEHFCIWLANDGRRRRRRSWTRRRRRWRKCVYTDKCDISVTGYVLVMLLPVKAVSEFVYWVMNKILEIWLKLFAWSFGWEQAYSKCVYRRYIF